MPLSRASRAQSSSSWRRLVHSWAWAALNPEQEVHAAHGLRSAARRRAPAPAGGSAETSRAVRPERRRDDDRRQAEAVGRPRPRPGRPLSATSSLALLDPVEDPVAVGEVAAPSPARSGPSPGPPRPGARRPRSPRRASPRRCRRRSRWRRRSPRPGSGAVLAHHRRQHLGRGDRRLRGPAGERDQALLCARDLLDRQLDPEVAAGDHDPALGRLDDLLGALGGLRLLDLGDQRDVAACARRSPRCDLLQVRRPAHEGDREQVDPELAGEVDPARRRSPGCRAVGVGARQVHALVGADRAAGLDLGEDLVALDGGDLEPDAAVGEEDRIARRRRRWRSPPTGPGGARRCPAAPSRLP